jgi:cation diffusion facilitator CzcD-associated flavoprotein CzcO
MFLLGELFLFVSSFAGICASIRLKTKLNRHDFTIFDDNNQFGGTWLLHSYPECGSDVPAHLYSFSFEPNPGKNDKSDNLIVQLFLVIE